MLAAPCAAAKAVLQPRLRGFASAAVVWSCMPPGPGGPWLLLGICVGPGPSLCPPGSAGFGDCVTFRACGDGG